MKDWHEHIETYVNGELDGDSLRGFEKALSENVALQQAVAQHRNMVARLHALRLRETVKKNMTRPFMHDVFFTFGRRLWVVAASIVLIVSAMYFFLHEPAPANTGIADLPPAPLNTPPTTDTPATPKITAPETPRSANPTLSEHLASDQKVLAVCADALRQMEPIEYTAMGGSHEKDTLAEQQLNEAIQWLLAQKPARAEVHVDAVLKKNNALYQQDAEWLHALSWLMRDPAKGKNLLEKIERAPAHTYRRKAVSLLGNLE